jgi:hypothetical protein
LAADNIRQPGEVGGAGGATFLLLSLCGRHIHAAVVGVEIILIDAQRDPAMAHAALKYEQL